MCTCFFPAGDVVGGSDDEDDDEQPAKKARKSSGIGGASSSKPKPRSKSRGSSEGGDGGSKQLKGFAKPQRISEELAAVSGMPEMSRGTLMKWLYAYVKEHDLYVSCGGRGRGWGA
jgi:chromatin remodeling complex protein RSC6